MWQLLSDMYPYPGAPDITPFAAFFEYAEQQHVGAGLRTPPPLVAATIHSVVRPEWARYDMNPIHAAAFDGRSDLVLPLLDIGDAGVVDPSDEVQRRWRVCTDRLVHPVHAAALGGRVALVRRLLAVPGVTQELEDDGGRTVFHFAAASRYASAADLVGLIDGDRGAAGWLRGDSGDVTPLHEAANTGTLRMVTRLLTAFRETLTTETDIVCKTSTYVEFPLHYAARSGNIAKFEAILTAMNVTKDELREVKSCHGAGVVHYALRSDSLDMVKHCMKYYDDNWDLVQETGSHGGGLLKCAGRSANPAVFAYAKQHVGHRPARSDDDGWTPLHSACAAGRRRMLRYLIEVEHYSPYAIDKDGYTVLHAAISSDSPFFFDEVAQLVNDDIRSRHFTSRESLGSLAIGKSNIAMLKHLVASGYCDLSVPPSKSRTTTYLTEAAQYSSLGVMEWLLQQGHRPWDVRDREGSSVRDIAMRRYDPVFVAGISALREKYPSTEGSTTSVHTEPER